MPLIGLSSLLKNFSRKASQNNTHLNSPQKPFVLTKGRMEKELLDYLFVTPIPGQTKQNSSKLQEYVYLTHPINKFVAWNKQANILSIDSFS